MFKRMRNSIVGVIIVLFLLLPIFNYDLFATNSSTNTQEDNSETVIEKEYVSCSTLELEKFASNDYLDFRNALKSRSSAPGYKELSEVTEKYINFFSFPDKIDSNNLFIPLKVSKNFSKEVKITSISMTNDADSDILHCGFNIDDLVLCDADRLSSSNTCVNSFIDNNNTVNITDCSSYDRAVELEKNFTDGNVACYPKNHICNLYKDDLNNKYISFTYNVVNNVEDNTNSGGSSTQSDDKNADFYVYVRNSRPEDDSGMLKNCNLNKLQCDINFNSDVSGYANFITYNTDKNKSFIEDITSGLDDEYKMFVYFDSCKLSDCKNYKDDSGNVFNILNSRNFYKYTLKQSEYLDDNTIVHIYTKDINGKLNRVCNGYLPNCADLSGNFKAVYDDRNYTSNFKARESAYNNNNADIKVVNEYELGFVGLTNNFSDRNCLAVNDSTNDIGYCSDLDENGSLKYPKGVIRKADSNMSPNCYLKSCIDLTPQELRAIVSTDASASNKYCSEYYYLNNDFNFKYFFRQKPNYCSDLNDEKLKFSEGINEDHSNCYLKNCFSLTDDERYAVIEAKKVGNYLSKYFNRKDVSERLKSAKRKEDLQFLLPKVTEYNDLYCKSGIYFKNSYDGFNDFDYLNINTIPCFKFTDEQLNVIGSNRVIYFTDILKKYDYKNSNYFCRSHFEKINTFNEVNNGNKLRDDADFFANTFVGSDETPLLNSSVYNNLYERLTKKNLLTDGLPREKSRYKSPDLMSQDVKLFTSNTIKRQSIYPICSFVDNSVLFYDTVIDSTNYMGFLNNSDISSATGSIFSGTGGDESTPPGPNPGFSDCVNRVNCKYDMGGTNCDDYKIKTVEYDDEKYNSEISSCRTEYCESGKEYCDFQRDLNSLFVNCEGFASSYAVDDSESKNLDCSLFSDYQEDKGFNSDIVKTYSTKYHSSDDKLDITLTDKDFEEIRSICELTLPLEVENEVIVDGIDSKVKPYSIEKMSYKNNNSELSLLNGKSIGCTSFNTSVEGEKYMSKLFERQVFGCMLPDSDSSYISRTYKTKQGGTDANLTSINGLNFLTSDLSRSTVFSSEIDFAVCSRFSSTNSISNNDCGNREGSKYSDKCNVFERGKKLNTLFSDKSFANSVGDFVSDGIPFLANSTSRFRFRKNFYGANEYLFRDFLTSVKCSSTYNLKYFDKKQESLVQLEAAAVGTSTALIALANASLVCGGSLIFFGLCSAAVFAAGYLAGYFPVIYTRGSEFILSLQNNLFRPNNYIVNLDKDDDTKVFYDGFLSKANITDNNDYIYRYYSRSDNIEDDIKNKLESSFIYDKNKGVKQTFYGNTTEEDIILKCKIYNLFRINNKDGDFSYEILDLSNGDTDPSSASVCSTQTNIAKAIESCLSKEQLDCLKGYGVTFLNRFSDDDNEVDYLFATSKGDFLKKYVDGSTASERWLTYNPTLDWLPYQKIYYTMDNRTRSEKISDENCKLMSYGDSFGSLDRCRGFEYDDIFYTESQPVPRPLLTSPFFFYNLLTPLNTPEFFNPTIVLDKYGKFTDYDSKNNFNNNLTNLITTNDVVLSFYNPILNYKYDFQTETDDPMFKNLYSDENYTLANIKVGDNASMPYILLYKSKNLMASSNSVQSYLYALVKTHDKTKNNTYIPRVCLNSIVSVPNTGPNTPLNLIECSDSDYVSIESFKDYKIGKNNRCISLNNKNNIFISTDNEVQCYDRVMPSLKDSFVMFPSYNMNFLNPVINVYLKPSGLAIEDVIENKGTYALYSLGTDSLDIEDVGENKIQSFGLNFKRSYCSKVTYDYYNYKKLLKEELNKDVPNDSFISLYKKSISSIESSVIPDCNKMNGNEIEVVLNEEELKTIKSAGSIDKVVFKETAKVKEYNEVYGGFSEICLNEKNVSEILEKYTKQNNMSSNYFEKVLTYRDLNNTRLDRKCVLDSISRGKKSCLVGERVYIRCPKEKEDSPECKKVINMTDNNYVYIKEIDCTKYLNIGLNDINTSNISEVQACFKGGFNTYGRVYKKPSSESGIPEVEDSCSCLSVSSNSVYNVAFFEERTITPREFGLCINLEEPIVCPAVRYYDSNKKYVDNALFLGCVDEKCSNIYGENSNIPSSWYEQHFWRTDEKILGKIPAVLFSKTLGNAEFPSSIYCEADKKGSDLSYCVDSNNGNVEGECLGYWKYNDIAAPTAVCTAYKKDDKTYYEYKINGNNTCVRYSCDNLGYDYDGDIILDEKNLIANDSSYFTRSEVNLYSKIKETDYRSFEHNQELDSNSIDIRGLSNAFATWRAQTLTNDFALEITSKRCITGFGPIGANVLSYLNAYPMAGSDGTSIDYNNKNNSNYNKIIDFYSSQQDNFDNVVNTAVNSFPKRICNQLGEWQKVDNIYTSQVKLIDQNENNLYYHAGKDSEGKNNFWVRVGEKTFGDGKFTSTDFSDSVSAKYGNLINKYASTGYCERLFCRELKVDNLSYNIYSSELIAGKYRNDITGLKVWQHNGGALWNRISAPRNSSKTLSTDDRYSSYNVSQNIKKVFADYDGQIIEDSYKHLKKVYGACQPEYGYYNRETQFSVNNFYDQLSNIKSYYNKDLYSPDSVDPRNVSLDSGNEEQIKPSRACTSTGLWDAIKDPCYRACEMIDIYHMGFNDRIYKENITNRNILIENSDILTIDTSIDMNYDGDLSPDKDPREIKYRLLNLDSANLEESYGTNKAVRRGDFVTGGAYWPRTVFNSNKVVGATIGVETSGEKKGLRYVEVTGTCDSSYNDKDSNLIRTYVKYRADGNSVSVEPKRRCYEDGTWGPVIGDTRCVLYKNCKTFDITLEDLNSLIDIYNSNGTLEKLNGAFSVMPYDRNNETNTVCGVNNKKYCNIGSLEAKSTSIGDSYSENTIDSPSKGFVATPTKLICNISGIPGENNYSDGWNLKTRDIGLYFVPQVCNNNTSFYSKNESVYGNVSEVLNKLVKEIIYDENNSAKEGDNVYENGFYVEDSRLQYLSKFNLKFTNNDKNDTISSIKIGSKQYGSYQRAFICNKKYYYNKIDGSPSEYIDKKIVLNCYAPSDSVTKYYNLKDKASITTLSDDLKNDKSEVASNNNFIRFEDCVPRSCGQNKYHGTWSQSDISGVSYNNSNTNTTESVLSCGSGKAFVLNDYKNINLSLYADPYFVNDTSFAPYGFFGALRLSCVDHLESGKINGWDVLSNSYDYVRYGDIDISGFFPNDGNNSISFCKDVAKKDCRTFTRSEFNEMIIRDSNTFLKNYCVPMRCENSNLKLNNGAIEEKASNGFTLQCSDDDDCTKKYGFGKNVIIESRKSDFENYYILNSESFSSPNVVDQYNYTAIVETIKKGEKEEQKITGYAEDTNIHNLCPSGYDIYNEGMPTYNTYSFVQEVENGNGKNYNGTTALMCFSLLNNADNVLNVDVLKKGSASCSKDYELCVDGKNMCCKLSSPEQFLDGSDYVKKENDIKYVNLLKEKVEEISNKMDNEAINDIKDKLFNYIIDNVIDENGDYIENNKVIKDDKQLEIKNIISNNKAKIFNNILDNSTNGIIYLCSADGNLKENMVEVNDIGMNDNAMKFDSLLNLSNKQKPDKYFEDSTNTYTGYYYLKENSDKDMCKVSVEEYDYRSLSNANASISVENNANKVYCSDCSSVIGTSITYNGATYIGSGNTCSGSCNNVVSCSDSNNCNDVVYYKYKATTDVSGTGNVGNDNFICSKNDLDSIVFGGMEYTKTSGICNFSDSYSKVSCDSGICSLEDIASVNYYEFILNDSVKCYIDTDSILNNIAGFDKIEAVNGSSTDCNKEGDVSCCVNIKSNNNFIDKADGYDITTYSNKKDMKNCDEAKQNLCLKIKTTISKAADLYVSVDDVMNKYNNEYYSNISSIREEILKKLKSNTNMILNYDNIYNYFYNSYLYDALEGAKIGENKINEIGASYALAVDSNTTYFNLLSSNVDDFLLVDFKEEVEHDAVIIEKDGIVVNVKSSETAEEFFAYKKTINGLTCTVYSTSENEKTIPASCNVNSLSDDNLKVMNAYFEALFYVNDNSTNISNKLVDYVDNVQDELNVCYNRSGNKGVYIDFLERKKGILGSSEATLKSGFFMGMTCTPNGWIVVDKPSCKSRCSGTSDTYRLDPYGVGDWNVSVTVSGLRYNTNINTTFVAHADSMVSNSGFVCKGTRVYCNANNGIASFHSDDCKTNWSSYLYWGIRINAYTKFYSSDDGPYIDCEHDFHSLHLQLATCNPKDHSVSGVRESFFGKTGKVKFDVKRI